jgi:hypothetical protein
MTRKLSACRSRWHHNSTHWRALSAPRVWLSGPGKLLNPPECHQREGQVLYTGQSTFPSSVFGVPGKSVLINSEIFGNSIKLQPRSPAGCNCVRFITGIPTLMVRRRTNPKRDSRIPKQRNHRFSPGRSLNRRTFSGHFQRGIPANLPGKVEKVRILYLRC